jgi:hypothetical protein
MSSLPSPPSELRFQIRRAEDCRCDDLRDVFGAGAPLECGPCKLRRRYTDLLDAGFVMIPDVHRLRFEDCGVMTATTIDHKSWAPAWAVLLVDNLAGSLFLQPILCRAAVDPEFAEACATILMQSPPGRVVDGTDPSAKVVALACVRGVTTPREK